MYIVNARRVKIMEWTSNNIRDTRDGNYCLPDGTVITPAEYKIINYMKDIKTNENINDDITKLIQRIEQLEHEQKILNSYNEALEKEINNIKDDQRRLDNDLKSNYEVLVELNHRVDTITPKQLQSNDDDTTNNNKLQEPVKAVKKGHIEKGDMMPASNYTWESFKERILGEKHRLNKELTDAKYIAENQYLDRCIMQLLDEPLLPSLDEKQYKELLERIGIKPN